MAHEEPGVHPDLVLEPVEPFAEGTPPPVEALLERGKRHPLDPGHHAGEVLGVLLSCGSEREAAVAAYHGRHAVKRRRARRRVPEQLRVVVGVKVDEARHDHEPVGVDRAGGRLVAGAGLSDHGDAFRAYAHVAPTCRSTGAVGDGPSFDQQVEHLRTSLSSPPSSPITSLATSLAPTGPPSSS